MHVVFEPKNMSPDDLQKVFFQMWQKSYTTKKILKRLRNTRKDKIIKLSANLGFKYYAYKLRKAGV